MSLCLLDLSLGGRDKVFRISVFLQSLQGLCIFKITLVRAQLHGRNFLSIQEATKEKLMHTHDCYSQILSEKKPRPFSEQQRVGQAQRKCDSVLLDDAAGHQCLLQVYRKIQNSEFEPDFSWF
jgi:hypothetical protein